VQEAVRALKTEVQSAAATAAAAHDRALSAAIEGLGKEASAALRESDAAATKRDEATRAAVRSEVGTHSQHGPNHHFLF
jgi:hypothetical protein